MYIPDAFREDRPEVLRELMRQHSFATLITSAPALLASHVPLLFDLTGGEHGTLIGHLARPNPQLAALAHLEREAGEALAVFHGSHAYVSPNHYASGPAVPTWNYAVVHAYGTPRLVQGGAPLRQILERTVLTYEGESEAAWSMRRVPAQWAEAMMRGVVGFELVLTRLEGKFKLNQNKPRVDQQGVIMALSGSLDPSDRAVAELMRQRPPAAQGDRP